MKEHGVFLHYTYEDFLHDRVTSEVAERAHIERHRDPYGRQRAG